jgi:hypothetical protein
MPEMEKASGVHQQAYMQWLKERKRQHSISAMIQFSDWLMRSKKG